MQKNHEQQGAVLLGAYCDIFDEEHNSSDESMDELEELLKAAGGRCIARAFQNRRAPDPASFFGEGKLEEVKELAQNMEAELLVVDNDLSPSQHRAIEKATGLQTVERTGLILDIFASRAKTDEGKLQVALAQYKYLLPRLTGMWTHLVRQTASGGSSPIGTRGPGETQLETDRRHIRRRIEKLEEELGNLHRIRAQSRRLREKNDVPMVSLVGYTNAGKSTLLNRLCNEAIPANDRLFDTLDNTTRRLSLAPGSEILLTDTVGFIRRLPHHLIDAFAATLDELKFADVILKVNDLSNPDLAMQSGTVERLIDSLCPPYVPVIEVYNKLDRVSADILPRGERVVCVSAKTGEGLDLLIEMITAELAKDQRSIDILLPFDQSGLLERIHKEAAVSNVEYLETGAKISLTCGMKLYGRLRQYEV